MASSFAWKIGVHSFVTFRGNNLQRSYQSAITSRLRFSPVLCLQSLSFAGRNMHQTTLRLLGASQKQSLPGTFTPTDYNRSRSQRRLPPLTSSAHPILQLESVIQAVMDDANPPLTPAFSEDSAKTEQGRCATKPPEFVHGSVCLLRRVLNKCMIASEFFLYCSSGKHDVDIGTLHQASMVRGFRL